MGRQSSTLDQALPVLLLSRSASPFLRDTELRGRCPKTKILPFVSERRSFTQAVPASQSAAPQSGCAKLSARAAAALLDTDRVLARAVGQDSSRAQAPVAAGASSQACPRDSDAPAGQALLADESPKTTQELGVSRSAARSDGTPFAPHGESQHSNLAPCASGQALLTARSAERHVVEHAQPKRSRYVCFALLALCLGLLTLGAFHKSLEDNALRNYQEREAFEAFGEDWGVLLRAGGPWHDASRNASHRSQALPACAPRKCFFVHMGPYADVLQGGRQYLVVPLDTPSSTWREAVAQRVAALDSRLLPEMAKMACAIGGNILR